MRFRATEMFSNWGIFNSTKRLQWLSKKLDREARAPAQEMTKITDDSLLLFHSEAMARHLPIIRFVDTASPLYILFLGTTWSSVLSYGAMMAFYIPFIRGLGHSSVVRMDLVPSMEAIAFQKVGFFGSVRIQFHNFSKYWGGVPGVPSFPHHQLGSTWPVGQHSQNM